MKKNILIIGTGSIAERHLKNIISISSKINIFILSENFMRAEKFSYQFKKKNIKPISFKNVIEREFTHVIIANKTKLRNFFLKFFLSKKCNIYCEKPLPNDKNFYLLKKISNNIKKVEQVKMGFQFRFNPVVQYLKKKIKEKNDKNIHSIHFSCGQNLKDWRKNTDYKKLTAGGSSYYSSVSWELCHELDLLQYIFEKPNKLFSSIRNTNFLQIKAADISTTIFNFKNKNINCSINLEMLSPKIYRKLVIVSLNNYYEADLIKNKLTVLTNNKKKILNFKPDRNLMFKNLMKGFLLNKRKTKKFNYATLRDGIFVTDVIKKMYLSNKLKRLVSL